jgi:hypothetical protein
MIDATIPIETKNMIIQSLVDAGAIIDAFNEVIIVLI